MFKRILSYILGINSPSKVWADYKHCSVAGCNSLALYYDACKDLDSVVIDGETFYFVQEPLKACWFHSWYLENPKKLERVD